MLSQDPNVFIVIREILYHYGEGVDINSFVTYDQLLECAILAASFVTSSTDSHGCIVYIKLMTPHSKILKVLGVFF